MTPAGAAEAQNSTEGAGAPAPHSFGLFPPVLYPINLQDWETDAGPADVRAIGRLADELGYGFIACGDHGALATTEPLRPRS